MADSAGLPRCANCGVEIPWRPAMHRGKSYCCGGCVQGGPCYCSYDLTSLDAGAPRSRGAAAGHQTMPPASRKTARSGRANRPASIGVARERW